MVEKQKMIKDQKTFYKCNMCNNTIKIIFFFFFITTRKTAKWIKSKINAVDGLGLVDNYNRQIQGQSNSRTTCVMLKKQWEAMIPVMSLWPLLMERSSKLTKLSFQHQESSRSFWGKTKIIIHRY